MLFLSGRAVGGGVGRGVRRLPDQKTAGPRHGADRHGQAGEVNAWKIVGDGVSTSLLMSRQISSCTLCIYARVSSKSYNYCGVEVKSRREI